MLSLAKLLLMRAVMLICLCAFFNVAIAQSAKPKLTENSTVKDADGTVFPVTLVKALLMKGGHTLKAIDSDTFLLIALTEEQKQDRLDKMPKPKESDYFTTGKKIKLPNVTDLNGKRLRLKEAAGKIVVLNFWFINCPPCRMEIPDLNELVASYKGNDSIEFVAVALDDRESLKMFLSDMPFNYQVVANGRYITDNFGIRSYPTHLIIDPKGEVYFHTSGLGTNTVHWLKKSIDQLLIKAVPAPVVTLHQSPPPPAQ